MRKRMWFAACAAATMAVSACGGGASTAPPPATNAPTAATNAPTRQAAGAQADIEPERRDVPYVAGGVERQKLNLFTPDDTSQAPFPVVVWLHGGRWREGDKNQIDTGEQGMDQFKALLLQHGYAVASANYRLVPDSRFPDPLQDAADAVRYLKTNASGLGLDPARVAIGGESAGGHLATLEGLSSAAGGLRNGKGVTGADSSVQAVLGYYGQYDLRTRAQSRAAVGCGGGGDGRTGIDSTEGQLLNADPTSPEGKVVAGDASPLEYVSAQAPPTMLFAGRQDCSAPHVQAQQLHDALKAAGVPTELEIIDAGHGAPEFYVDGDLQTKLIAFLDAHVKN